MPERSPLSLAPLAPEPVQPFNVVRDAGAPILTATELTSFAYQHLLEGTPWQYYRLVVTQWPRLEGNQATPIPADPRRQRRQHLSRRRRVLGVREPDDGDVRSEGRAARVHELPQPRAHDDRLHVERVRSRLSVAARGSRGSLILIAVLANLFGRQPPARASTGGQEIRRSGVFSDAVGTIRSARPPSR